MAELSKVRIDKWLWTVRIFKSRTLATKTCKSGKAKINDKIVKPSAFVVIGDVVKVRKNGFDLQFEVCKLISSRVSATLAAPCYQDQTPPEELNKYKSWFIGKASAEKREKGVGRPTKRERRELDGFKEEQWWEMLADEDLD